MRIQVALVDDEQSAREYISSMKLWHEGTFSLAICASGAENLLQCLNRTAVDILLMDVSMPDINGVELSRRIREKFPQIDIIAISNYDQYDYVREILKNGARDYLLKMRLTEESLKATLERIAEQRQMPQAADTLQYREQLRRFLQGNTPWPIPSDGSVIIPCFGTLPALTAMEKGQRETIARSIEKLLEENADENCRCIAAAYDEDRFLLLIRFFQTKSRALLERQTHYVCAQAIERVSRIYHLELAMEAGPVLLDQSTLPSYVLQHVRQKQTIGDSRPESITLEQRSEIIRLLTNGAEGLLRETLESILHRADQLPLQKRFFLIRSMVELGKDICREWHVDVAMPPDGNQLLQWINQRPYDQVRQDILQLFSRILKEKQGRKHADCSEPVQQALDIMLRDFDRPLTLGTIASQIGVHESYLSRLFNRELGTSFNRYLSEVRMQHAKQLLTEGIHMKEVAVRSGFVQYTHFLRVFKQVTGETPKEFLKKAKTDSKSSE